MESVLNTVDLELSQINAEQAWRLKETDRTKELLEQKGNPSIDQLIDEMISCKRFYLEEILKQVQRNIK